MSVGIGPTHASYAAVNRVACSTLIQLARFSVVHVVFSIMGGQLNALLMLCHSG